MSLSINLLLNKFRDFILPIYKGERRKFAIMFILFFLISFNYNILRAVKDALVVTASSSGAEVIPFIKLWAMLPMALLLTSIFAKLSNKYGQEKVFYIMITMFLSFFLIFTFLLYPFRNTLNPDTFADFLQIHLPTGLHGLISIIRNWTLTSFYVMSELWGTIVLSVLFWGFANEVTSITEAKRFYTLFGLGANIAGIFAGQVNLFLSRITYKHFLPYGKSSWDQSIFWINFTIILCGLVIICLYKLLNKKVIKKDLSYINAQKNKKKQSLKKSFAYLSKSKYLICIAVIVIMYNVALNLVEIIWKNQVRELYPNPADYSAYMSQVISLIGIIATITAIFISGNIIRKFSWTFNALIAPITMVITGVLFFSFILFKNTSFAGIASMLGTTPIMMIVFFGTMQNSLARASKYTLFDATKEMAFIPLDKDSKLKGKASIDGVGSRLGKSGGSVIHQSLLVLLSSLSACTPYIAVIFLVIISIWIVAVTSLGKQFNTLVGIKAKPRTRKGREKVEVAIEKAFSIKKSKETSKETVKK